MDDSVGDYFVDRTGGTARIEDFTVLVHRLPPEPAEEAEIGHSARDESVAPNSSARYLKRPRNSLPEDAVVTRYANGYGVEGHGLTHKRQRLNYAALGDVLEQRDRPIASQERDSQGSIHIVENSQRSPRTSRMSCRHSTHGVTQLTLFQNLICMHYQRPFIPLILTHLCPLIKSLRSYQTHSLLGARYLAMT